MLFQAWSSAALARLQHSGSCDWHVLAFEDDHNQQLETSMQHQGWRRMRQNLTHYSIRAVPMVHWWWFLWVITIFSFSLPTLSFPPMGVRHELPRNWWFLPNGDFMVSWCIGSRVDLVSSWRNHFYDFCSLSSLITLPHQRFAYVASHLMRIETIINAPLGLPL